MQTSPIRVLQIGAGSMGTRRLRDLAGRADVVLAVFDERADRVERARERFSVTAFSELPAALAWQPDVLVISTPPDCHELYVDLALSLGLHHFCEAHVWTPDFHKVEAASNARGLVSACSCSMHFLPVVKSLKEIVAGRLGDLHVYQMCLSTWLPSWHPWEQGAFYAWRRPTAAAREMVPFEFTYLSEIFGPATAVAGSVSRRGSLDVEGDDTWCLQMNLAGGAHGQLAVLMASPAATRHGCCFGTQASAMFDIAAGEITLTCADGQVDHIACGSLADTIEPAYRAEINLFMDAVLGRAAWPHSYRDSAQVTATLAAAERSAESGRWEKVDPEVQPGRLPATC
jgi:predicted dehydrogenase